MLKLLSQGAEYAGFPLPLRKEKAWVAIFDNDTVSRRPVEQQKGGQCRGAIQYVRGGLHGDERQGWSDMWCHVWIVDAFVVFPKPVSLTYNRFKLVKLTDPIDKHNLRVSIDEAIGKPAMAASYFRSEINRMLQRQLARQGTPTKIPYRPTQSQIDYLNSVCL